LRKKSGLRSGERGFVQIREKPAAGTFLALHHDWLVPHSVQGFYPDWLLRELYEHVRLVSIVS
jgi:hypothetical protein